IILFASHNVISDMCTKKLGYCLLQCIWCFLVLDMYALLNVHTEDTIIVGKQALLTFEQAMKEYLALINNSKNWNFPKIYSYEHLFADIQAKGTTCNFNTKPNEKIHGALKDIYDL
ncbi:hypothetical protein HETIRDRAFT_329029, partial [Heterobasidion irregulare TC 32-1]